MQQPAANDLRPHDLQHPLRALARQRFVLHDTRGMDDSPERWDPALRKLNPNLVEHLCIARISAEIGYLHSQAFKRSDAFDATSERAV